MRAVRDAVAMTTHSPPNFVTQSALRMLMGTSFTNSAPAHADAGATRTLEDIAEMFNLPLPFVEKLREGYDLVIGNRFAGGIEPGAMPWANKYIGNPVLSSVARVLFHSRISDFHCGLRGFNRDRIRELDLHAPGMEFATEMIVMAELNGLRITEVPTTLKKDGRTRRPHLRPLRDGLRHLRYMISTKKDYLREHRQ